MQKIVECEPCRKQGSSWRASC